MYEVWRLHSQHWVLVDNCKSQCPFLLQLVLAVVRHCLECKMPPFWSELSLYDEFSRESPKNPSIIHTYLLFILGKVENSYQNDINNNTYFFTWHSIGHFGTCCNDAVLYKSLGSFNFFSLSAPDPSFGPFINSWFLISSSDIT